MAILYSFSEGNLLTENKQIALVRNKSITFFEKTQYKVFTIFDFGTRSYWNASR